MNAVTASITEFESELRKLAVKGAQGVVVPNQIDPSSAPFFNGYGPPSVQSPLIKVILASLTVVFNTQLDAMLAGLMSDPTLQMQLYPVDMFTLFKGVEVNPSAYGFSNATDPAVLLGVDPTGYLFWDPIHPTTEGHRLMADAAYQAIPLPGTLPLLALAMAVFAAGAAVRSGARGSV